VTRLALCIIGLIAVLVEGCGEETSRDRGAGEPARTAPKTITEADNGKSFALAPGAEARLRLPGAYDWSEPTVGGEAVRLTRVDYFQDPGFSEWIVEAVQPGTSTIAARGTPAGPGRRGRALEFQVEIVAE
jgi:predicted secreted protein